MRIISATLLGLSLVAGCTIGDQGGGGGSGTTGGGDDVQAGSDAAVVSNTPMLTATVDNATQASELGLSPTVTVKLVASGGFAGTVTLSPTLVNGAGSAIADITVTGAGSDTIDLDANGSASVVYTLAIPTNAALVSDGATGGTSGTNPVPSTLAATFNVAIAGGPAAVAATQALTVANQYSVVYKNGTSTTANTGVANHFRSNTPIIVKRGAILAFKNEDTGCTGTCQHVTHGDGQWPHQEPADTAGTAPAGSTYLVDTGLAPAGSTGQLGCHTHGASTYTTFTTE